MNYKELRDQFKDDLNRSDCSDSRADRFLSLGIRRFERLLRTPVQKNYREYTVDENWTGYLMIPADYLGFVSMKVSGEPVSRIEPSQRDDMNGFYINENRFFFSPSLKEGQTVTLGYYTEFPKGIEDDDLTAYTTAFADITLYAALVFAGDFFVDERTARWEKTMAALVEETQSMADTDEMSGGLAVTPYGGGIA